jgi:hypothetical protein
MPAKSAAQRRWAFGVMGEKWARAHHFDTKGKLPKRVSKGRTRHPLTRSMIEKGQM